MTVTGLPDGLSYANGQVSGTVSQSAAVQDHTVTISAKDADHAAVTEEFTVTVRPQELVLSPPPAPGDPKPSPASIVSIQGLSDPVEEGYSASLPVSLSAPVSGTVTVTWSSTAGASGSSGTSQASKHEHEPSSGTVTFQPGQTQATITITILDDEEHESLESFFIVLDEVNVSSSSDRASIGQSTAEVFIGDNDAPPEFIEGDEAVRSVAENTPPGTAIGAPIAASDAENDPLTFTLSGADADTFTIDGKTGQLRVKDPLDFEARSTYDALTVTVGDGHSHTDTLSLTISVTDVDEPPAKPAAPKVVLNSSDSYGALDVTWAAPDMTGKPAITDYDVRYRVAGATAWNSHAFAGTGTRTTLTGLRAGTAYQVPGACQER